MEVPHYQTEPENRMIQENLSHYPLYFGLAIVKPSCVITNVSTATSLPSDFKSVLVIFEGHAFLSVHVIVGFPASSNN